VVTTSIAESLRPALPALQRESSWYLLYSLDQHGISLNTLYTFCTEANTVDPTNGCLLAIKSEKGAIFGAFSNEGLHLSKGHYFGNQNCFLWRYEVGTSDTIADAGVRVWPPTGLNTYFVLCEPGEIAFGGGGDGFGLWLDGELYNGHSGVCETFGNECLNESGSESDSNSQSRRKGEFIVAGLEVWGF
ncbi:TLD-domain-containing protein, partial [Gaertneriomyces semiglobifer]